MNRYLCKAKMVNNNKWVQGYYVECDDYCNAIEHFIIEKNNICVPTNEKDGLIEIDPKTLCQCSGIPDKNGKLIFVGDYVLTNTTDKNLATLVYFDEETACILGKSKQCRKPLWFSKQFSKSFEIIGNVHDKEGV